jgi:hypothetical protein
MDLFSFLSFHSMCVTVTVVTGHSMALNRSSHLFSTMSSLHDVLVHDIVFDKALVNPRLKMLGADVRCATRKADCYEDLEPCECTGETKGQFAYTEDRLLKDGFLDKVQQSPRASQSCSSKSCSFQMLGSLTCLKCNIYTRLFSLCRRWEIQNFVRPGQVAIVFR